MRIDKVTVRMGRVIPGPEYGGGQYANIKPEIELSASVAEGESVDDVVRQLGQQGKVMLEGLAAELIGRPIQPKPQYAPQPQPVAAKVFPGGTYPATNAQGQIPKVDPVTW